MNFNEFLDTAQRTNPRPSGRFRGRLLALDPGETTGWSIWDSHDNATKYELLDSGQLPCWDKAAKSQTSSCLIPCAAAFPQLVKEFRPDIAVLESYRVYEWLSDSHSWSDVPTLRIIGSMETRLHDEQIPYYFQTAQVAKNFVTDDLLKEWNYWKRGERHARDSMRHGLYFLLFGAQGQQR